MTIAVGKANYSSGSGNFERPPFFKLGHKQDKDRVLVCRIAPPVGELAERGIWSRFLKQHFGYTIQVPGKNGGPARNIPVTFNCIEEKDFQSNTIKQRCPECDEIALQKKTLEEKVQKLKAEGKNEEEIDTATRFIKSWLKDHNLDKKWHLVAKDVSGRWGFLTISHSCYKLLKGNTENPGVIDRLVVKNIDPLGVERGVWFRFERRGTAWNDIKDLPDVLREERIVDGETMEVTKYDSLTNADLEQIAKLPSLDTLGRALTYEQIELLVKNGGEEEIVRTVMNLPKQAARGSGQSSAPAKTQTLADEFEDEPTPEPTPKTEVKAESAPAPSAPAVEDDEEAKLAAQLAAIKAKKAKAAAAAADSKVKVAETAKAASPKANSKIQEDLDMPMEDFLKKYENSAK